jgi:hypothetical protein
MMNRLKDYVRFIHGFQVYRPSHIDSARGLALCQDSQCVLQEH